MTPTRGTGTSHTALFFLKQNLGVHQTLMGLNDVVTTQGASSTIHLALSKAVL